MRSTAYSLVSAFNQGVSRETGDVSFSAENLKIFSSGFVYLNDRLIVDRILVKKCKE